MIIDDGIPVLVTCIVLLVVTVLLCVLSMFMRLQSVWDIIRYLLLSLVHV